MTDLSQIIRHPWDSLQNIWSPKTPPGSPQAAAPEQAASISEATPIGSKSLSQQIVPGESLVQSVVNASKQISKSTLTFVDSVASTPQLALPPRPANAPTGSAFWKSLAGKSGPEREQAIQAQILAGNVPDHLRSLKPLELSSKTKAGENLSATAYITPDYLAIGSTDDYVLVPMSPITGQAIADQTQTTLPTRKLVNEIYQQAQLKLAPKPQPAGPQMTSTPYYQKHDQTVSKQRAEAHAQPGDLIAGHKKDVVISNRLDNKPKSVAIYGWHQPSGKHIQPLSTVHENTYADYSHGVRLIGPNVIINGVSHPTAEVLAHPEWSKLLSDEGPIKNPRATRP